MFSQYPPSHSPDTNLSICIISVILTGSHSAYPYPLLPLHDQPAPTPSQPLPAVTTTWSTSLNTISTLTRCYHYMINQPQHHLNPYTLLPRHDQPAPTPSQPLPAVTTTWSTSPNTISTLTRCYHYMINQSQHHLNPYPLLPLHDQPAPTSSQPLPAATTTWSTSPNTISTLTCCYHYTINQSQHHLNPYPLLPLHDQPAPTPSQPLPAVTTTWSTSPNTISTLTCCYNYMINQSQHHLNPYLLLPLHDQPVPTSSQPLPAVTTTWSISPNTISTLTCCYHYMINQSQHHLNPYLLLPRHDQPVPTPSQPLPAVTTTWSTSPNTISTLTCCYHDMINQSQHHLNPYLLLPRHDQPAPTPSQPLPAVTTTWSTSPNTISTLTCCYHYMINQSQHHLNPYLLLPLHDQPVPTPSQPLPAVTTTWSTSPNTISTLTCCYHDMINQSQHHLNPYLLLPLHDQPVPTPSQPLPAVTTTWSTSPNTISTLTCCYHYMINQSQHHLNPYLLLPRHDQPVPTPSQPLPAVTTTWSTSPNTISTLTCCYHYMINQSQHHLNPYLLLPLHDQPVPTPSQPLPAVTTTWSTSPNTISTLTCCYHDMINQSQHHLNPYLLLPRHDQPAPTPSQPLPAVTTTWSTSPNTISTLTCCYHYMINQSQHHLNPYLLLPLHDQPVPTPSQPLPAVTTTWSTSPNTISTLTCCYHYMINKSQHHLNPYLLLPLHDQPVPTPSQPLPAVTTTWSTSPNTISTLTCCYHYMINQSQHHLNPYLLLPLHDQPVPTPSQPLPAVTTTWSTSPNTISVSKNPHPYLQYCQHHLYHHNPHQTGQPRPQSQWVSPDQSVSVSPSCPPSLCRWWCQYSWPSEFLLLL